MRLGRLPYDHPAGLSGMEEQQRQLSLDAWLMGSQEAAPCTGRKRRAVAGAPARKRHDNRPVH